jgi:PTH1 family peptidyl-tRNA hydrolase
MKLVVGLGNPGSQYSGTRHNVGFETVDALAAKLGWIGQRADFDKLAREKFNGLAMDGLAGSEKMLLLKPTTFMNVSGSAVQSAMAFYQLSPVDLLIVLDDLALPSGKIRLRAGGSSGGHNGLGISSVCLAPINIPGCGWESMRLRRISRAATMCWEQFPRSSDR